MQEKHDAGARRPSGFGSVGRGSAPAREAAKPAGAGAQPRTAAREAARDEEKAARAQVRREARAERRAAPATWGDGAPRARRLRRAALIAAIALAVLIALIAILGGGKRTVHQLPTVVREGSEAEFEPSATEAAAPDGEGGAET